MHDLMHYNILMQKNIPGEQRSDQTKAARDRRAVGDSSRQHRQEARAKEETQQERKTPES